MIEYSVLDDIVEMDKGQEESLLKQLVDLFQSQTPLQFAKMTDGFTKNDTSEVGRAAHTLKASCSYLGAMDMADLCKSLEAWGLKKDLPEARIDANEAKAKFEKLQSLYRANMAELNKFVVTLSH